MPLFDMFGQPQPDPSELPLLMQVPPEMQAPAVQMPPEMDMPISQPKQVVVNDLPAGGYSPSYQKQFDDAFADSMNLRKEQLEALKQKLAQAEANKPTGLAALNLKPFAAFTDSLTGQRNAQNYGEPVEVERSLQERQRLQDSVEKSGNALSDDQLGYLKLKAQEELYEAQAKRAERMASRSSNLDEDRLRKEYMNHPLYKHMGDINKAYTAIVNNPAMDGPAQQALVFQYSKILDPNSVVRETEYAQSAANAGKIAQATNLLERLKSGKMLTAEQVALMKEVAVNLAESARKQLDDHNNLYQTLAVNKGVSPKNVIIDPFYKGKAAKPASAKDGDTYEWEGQKYKVINGSWELVK